MCTHKWMYTASSRVCNRCGLEKRILCLDRFNKYSAPLHRGYDRSGRFKVKLDKLFGLHSGPKATDPVWEQLNAVQEQIDTPQQVRRKLRQFNIKNKHYDCTRIFCDTFTKFRVHVHNALRLKETLLRKFQLIHCSWRAYTPNEAFFSYDFLLRHLLEEANSPLIVYCKPPTNKRRRKKYTTKLQIIRARNDCKTLSQRPATNHSQSELEQPSTPQYQQPLVVDQYALVGEGEDQIQQDQYAFVGVGVDHLKRSEGQRECHELCPSGNSGKWRGGMLTLADAFFLLQKVDQAVRHGHSASDVNICELHRGI